MLNIENLSEMKNKAYKLGIRDAAGRLYLLMETLMNEKKSKL